MFKTILAMIFPESIVANFALYAIVAALGAAAILGTIYWFGDKLADSRVAKVHQQIEQQNKDAADEGRSARVDVGECYSTRGVWDQSTGNCSWGVRNF